MEENRNAMIIEIKNEYKKIDEKWLTLHYHTFVCFVLLAFVIEVVFVVSLYDSGDIVIPFETYVRKYLMAPVFFNSCLVLIGAGTMYFRFTQQVKTYMISLLFVGVCFVFFVVHNIFASLYLIFTLPILLTLIYCDYTLTTITASLSIIGKIISELFIVWDSDKVHPFDNAMATMDFTISICILLFFYAACMIVIHFEKEKNFASIQKEIERYQMKKKLKTDELTRTFNRTALRDAFDHMAGDTSENTYTFAMIDLDNFKQLNDRFGHDKGDQCLRIFGKILKKNCVDDGAFRFGGDEFCILFKNKDLEEILQICRNIQNDFKESHINDFGIPLTASVGIAQYKKQMSASELLQNTDFALYRSKKSKDSICVYDNAES